MSYVAIRPATEDQGLLPFASIRGFLLFPYLRTLRPPSAEKARDSGPKRNRFPLRGASRWAMLELVRIVPRRFSTLLVITSLFLAGLGLSYLTRNVLQRPERPVDRLAATPRVQTMAVAAVENSPRPPTLDDVFDAEPVFRAPLLVGYLAESEVPGVRFAFERLLEVSPESSWLRSQDAYLDPLYDYVFLRWIELDPRAGLEAVRRLNEYDELQRYVTLWGGRNPGAVWAELTDAEKSQHSTTILQTACRFKPKEGLALFFEANRPGDSIPAEVIDAVAEWSPESFPDLAVRALRAGIESVALVAGAWGRIDPERALDWAGQLHRLKDRRAAQAAVYGSLAATDPEGVKEIIAAMPKGALRTQSTARVIESLAAANIEDAVRWLKALTPGSDRTAALQAFGQWGGIEAAFEKVDLLIKHRLRVPGDLTFEAAAALTEEAPREAWALINRADGSLSSDQWIKLMEPHSLPYLAEQLDTLTSPGSRRQFLSALCNRWASEDLEGVKQFVADMGDSTEALHAAAAVARTAAAKDPDGLLAWAATLPKGIAEPVTLAAFKQFTALDAGTARVRLDQLADPVTRQLAIDAMIGPLASNDAAGAIELLRELPQVQQEKHYGSLAYHYVHIDPEGTSRWIAQLPVGNGRDRAVHQMIRGLTDGPRGVGIRDFEGAFHWAQVIASDRLRSQALRSSLGAWKAVDAESAFEALKQTELPDVEKAALLELFEP